MDLRPDLRVDDLREVFLVEDLRADLRGLLVRAADLRDEDLRDEDLREDVFLAPLLDARLRGTFSPFARASLKPMAIACLRLVTLRPPRVLSVPCFRRRAALATVELAFLLYFLPDDFRLDLRAAIGTSPERLISTTHAEVARGAPLQQSWIECVPEKRDAASRSRKRMRDDERFRRVRVVETNSSRSLQFARGICRCG